MRSEIMQDVVEDVCELSVSYPAGSVRVNGVIDRLVRYADGSRMIIDYKTGKPSKMEMERYEMQLAAYFLWVKRMFGPDPDVCLYFADAGEIRMVEMDEERAKLLIEQKIREN
jgi:ATP-dependent helicase/nuclease subunit A